MVGAAMTINSMEWAADDQIAVTFDHQGQTFSLTLVIEMVGSIRSFLLVKPTFSEGQLIHNSAYSMAFSQVLWRFVDGNLVGFPVSLTHP